MTVEPGAWVRLGPSPVTVTRLGLGTAPLGNLYAPVDEHVAEATVRRAVARGLGLVDTAPLYGHGLAELRVGRALSRLDAPPSRDPVVATKVGRLLRAGPPDAGHAGGDPYTDTPPLSPVFDFSRDGVRRSLEESLGRLGRDRVPLVHIHDPDDHYAQAVDEAYPALEELRAEGVLDAISVGMNQAALLARFVRDACLDGVLVAGRYTLLDQSALEDLLPTCEARGTGVVVGGVYNSGILADPRPGARYDYQVADPGRLAQARHLAEVCGRHGVPLKAAAVQFPLAHRAVTSVVVGARSPEELDETLAMATHPVPAALWRELREEGLVGASAPLPGIPPAGVGRVDGRHGRSQ